MQNSYIANEIKQMPDVKALEISWQDGCISHYRDVDLRRACRCTTCRQIISRGDVISCPEDIKIASMAPVGFYAIQICFSDGHDRGIFPWDYLRQLGERE